MPRIQAPDGTQIDFPDTMQDADIETAMGKLYPKQPGVPSPPLPAALENSAQKATRTGTVDPNGPGLESAIEHYAQLPIEGARQLMRAVPSFANSPKAGISDAIEGAGKIAGPMAAPAAAIAAPVATAGALAGSYLGGKAGSSGARLMNASPETERLAGNAGGIVGGMAGGIGFPRAFDAIPRTVRASQNFDTVMNAARSTPINTTAPSAIASRAQLLASRGATQPKVVADFINATSPGAGPVTYEAGRDFASNAGRLSGQDSAAMNGPMGRQVKLLSQALNTANEDAANQAGVGDQYRAAMKEYRQAQTLKSGFKTAAKVGGSIIGLGAAGDLARKYLIGNP